MSEGLPMSDPPWEIYWEDGFGESLRLMGITWETFDRLGRFGVDFLLHRNPYEEQATFALGGTESRYLQTRYRFPDLPAMVIAYRVDDEARAVTVESAEEVWQDDLDPYAPDPWSDLDLDLD
jgi:hypothetical protein